MDYSGAASKISSIINKLSDFRNLINDKDLDSMWSGSAHDNLTSNLSTCVSKLESQIDYLSKFQSALSSADEYNKYKTEKEDYTSKRKNLIIDDNYKTNYNQYTALINKATNNMNSSKSKANQCLNGIGTINAEFEKINYTLDNGYINYITDLDSLISLFKSGNLKKIPDGGSLYDYYTEEEVDEMLSTIKSKYSGRNAAVNCAIGIIGMAADVGMKLDYDWGGGHRTITDVDDIAAGVDCSAFASWAVNQGTDGDDFTTAATSGLVTRGTKVSYEEAQAGDILVYRSNGNGHAIFILENDVENGKFICAEASGTKAGVIVSERNYSSLKSNGYSARDLSEYYD